ncbi:5-methylcytosine-specific restriction endonuclease system specificity protein McrC [Allobacillus sp. SKP2-8]|uniref:5-methylcytosine-specific restriction endonuclease system specificity protein McrC n=1 Tax=unclassified Allobacillus TaxID=2628859 RepID=UPI00118430B5|nr:5-methylcytosine-specific restriction endonuclease system specificity protein McrC [Allobacillus sp. SKP2-8]TSJ65720.1 5-methylcytosine-specific restriction endonuclease system specificity protein McrC [Allobacillus sp. SKP2-8]
MIKVKNIYYMLAYAFKSLRKEEYEKIQTEEFENAADLFAAILAKGIGNQIKKGLSRDYTNKVEALHSPKGKINVSLSIKENSIFNKQLNCEFDEYTENILLNRILKTTSILLLRDKEVSTQRKKELKKTLFYLSNVDEINYRNIPWSQVKYHRNNSSYRLLINICYLIIEGMLMTDQEGNQRLAKFIDDQKMHSLFEKFVLGYYQKHYPELNPSAKHIQWNTGSNSIEFLPVMKTDITLSFRNKTLIIDTKYYQNTMSRNFYGNDKYHSHNLYQIFTYVKNMDINNTGRVSGMLLYAKTGEEITPDNEFYLSGNRFGIKTLDLNNEFSDIEKQLEQLVSNFL